MNKLIESEELYIDNCTGLLQEVSCRASDLISSNPANYRFQITLIMVELKYN